MNGDTYTAKKGNMCFAYDKKKGICKALNDMHEWCGTKRCPFFKTAEERESSRKKQFENAKKRECHMKKTTSEE